MRGRNGVIFLTAATLALLIWLLTNLSREYSGVISVPVIAECNIDGHSNVSVNAAMVSARCRASGYRLLQEETRKNRKPERVRLDRADIRLRSGDQFYLAGSAKNNYVQQFFGDEVSVEAFISDTLLFTFPAENHKKVPVELVHDIDYRTQYMMTEPIRLVPDSIMVYGEPGRLESVERIRTAPLSISDLHESKHGVLRLSKIKGVRLSAEEVSYELTVSRYVELRSEVPIEVRNAPPGRHLQVYPSEATVILRCIFPFGRDPFTQFHLYVDYADFAKSLSGRCVPHTEHLPSGVLDCRIAPEVFDCIEVD